MQLSLHHARVPFLGAPRQTEKEKKKYVPGRQDKFRHGCGLVKVRVKGKERQDAAAEKPRMSKGEKNRLRLHASLFSCRAPVFMFLSCRMEDPVGWSGAVGESSWRDVLFPSGAT